MDNVMGWRGGRGGVGVDDIYLLELGTGKGFFKIVKNRGNKKKN